VERKLRKTALYSFFIGLAIAILYVPDATTLHQAGGTTTFTLPLRDYVLKVLRLAITISLAATIVIWVRESYKGASGQGFAEFAVSFVKGFITVLALCIILIFIIPLMIRFFQGPH
jgi:hypothetical protein